MNSCSRWVTAAGAALMLGGCAGHSVSTTDAAPSAAHAAHEPAPCLTGPGVTTLFKDAGSSIAIAGDHAVFTTIHGLLSVPIGGGEAVTLAQVDEPNGLLLIGDNIYFTADNVDGAPDAQGKQPSATALYSLPLAGGEPTLVLTEVVETSGWATDGTSLYFASSWFDVDHAYTLGISKWTPPASTSTAVPLVGRSIVDAIATHGDYVYVATQDIDAGSEAGAIQRLPKAGGAAEVIVANIGHPWALLADGSGLYWVEDPPTGTFGDSHIVHATLDGKSMTTLATHGSSGMALAGDYLYFENGVIGRIPKAGGKEATIAADQQGADFLTVAGGNLVWLNHVSKALSDPSPITVNTACIEAP